MMQIPIEDLLESLKSGYQEYKESVENGSDETDLAHIKGFCTTIEQMLSLYGKVSVETIMEIKRPIIGNISLRRKKKNSFNFQNANLDEPTILRQKNNN
jgi:hypothetical protein